MKIASHISNLLLKIVPFFQPSETNQVWLVGGSIRDILCEVNDITDLDLAVSFNPVEKCKKFANATNSGYVLLDDERHIVRIVYEDENKKSYTFDVSEFRANTIDDDLRLRDFTINAIAAPLFGENINLLKKNEINIYDPLNGNNDLKNKKINLCSPASFVDDPLRIMRAFRFAALFNAELSQEVLNQISQSCKLLEKISGERIRDELFKVLDVKNSFKWLSLMSETKVLDIVFPELSQCRGVTQNEWHHLDVFNHTLLTFQNFEKLISLPTPHRWWKNFENYLNTNISGQRTYKQSFKLACLTHDLGKIPCKNVDSVTGKVTFHCHEMEGMRIVKEISERLKLSANELSFHQKVVKNHMRPGVMLQQGLSDKRLYRYYTECGLDGTGIALLSLADRLSALGNYDEQSIMKTTAGIYEIMDVFFEQINIPKPKPFITGKELIKLGAQPGPIFKKIIDTVAEAQYTNEIKTYEEAVELAKKLLD